MANNSGVPGFHPESWHQSDFPKRIFNLMLENKVKPKEVETYAVRGFLRSLPLGELLAIRHSQLTESKVEQDLPISFKIAVARAAKTIEDSFVSAGELLRNVAKEVKHGYVKDHLPLIWEEHAQYFESETFLNKCIIMIDCTKFLDYVPLINKPNLR